MRVVIETNSHFKKMLEEIAHAIDAKITFEENDADFWDKLPEQVKSGISESQKQYKEGNFTTFEVVREELLARNHRK